MHKTVITEAESKYLPAQITWLNHPSAAATNASYLQTAFYPQRYKNMFIQKSGCSVTKGRYVHYIRG